MPIEARRGPGRPRDDALAERRREQILDTATEVFAANGIRGTDVQEIADRLRVGKGTIYRYFPSKEELFLAAVRRGMDQITERIRVILMEHGDGVAPSNGRAHLVRLMGEFLGFLDENPLYIELLVLERAEFHEQGRLTFFEYREALREEFRRLEDELSVAGILRYPAGSRETDVIAEMLYGYLLTTRLAGGGLSGAARRRVWIEVLLDGWLK